MRFLSKFIAGAFAPLAASAITTAVLAANISGAGATFPFPIYSKWAAAYKGATGNGLNYQSIGSGGGIKQIEYKTVTLGAPHMPLSGQVLDRYGQVQFPIVVASDVPLVNRRRVAPRLFVLERRTLAGN